MVRLMNITKRGNQAFDTALQAAKDVINTVETNMNAQKDERQQQQQDENQTENDQNNLNFPSLDLDLNKTTTNNTNSSSNHPLSRAGSYRLKRQAKKKQHHTTKHKQINDQLQTMEMQDIDLT
ncbi:unnamed protein product, partial [Schistosoma turkestanicum]